ncbi:MAG TPA: zf-HC2 domain-containing protein [Terriglobia bacterium]|nr:zf-HC2 domain-containing protein [Terriglobia bacterium]
MGCPEREARLLEWILDELAPAEVRELEQHVKQCADCSRSVERLRSVHGALMNTLTEREMPAHLVFIPDQPKQQFAGFLTSLWRTAALAATAAAIFLGIFVGGASHWRNRLGPAPIATAGSSSASALSPADVKALAAQEVERQMAFERAGLEASNDKLAASLREEQAKNLDRLARGLEFVQKVQNNVWEETRKQSEQQGEIVELIARNSLESKVPASGKR